MNGKTLENGLIEHCAPTLAGLKSASLFRYLYSSREKAVEEMNQVNHQLNPRGVFVEPLQWTEGAVLIYAYRYSHLQKELKNPEAREILAEYGYPEADVEPCIAYLKKRLFHYTCFPHEIGVFLGYPLEDVKGFIENGGQNCKCCGLWKVYCDEKEKTELFHKLTKCTRIYGQVFSQGKNIVQMTISA